MTGVGVWLCIYTVSTLHIHIHTCSACFSLQSTCQDTCALFSLPCTPEFSLPNPGVRPDEELAQSDPGPLVHKSLYRVVQGASLSRKPSWTPLSIHPLFSAPITASALHWELAVHVGRSFPADGMPHLLCTPTAWIGQHTQTLVKTGGYWPEVNEQITRSIHRGTLPKGKCQSLRRLVRGKQNQTPMSILRSFHDRFIPWQVRHQFRCYMSRPELL